VCDWTYLRVEHIESPFLREFTCGEVLRIPVAHGEGNYFADPDTLAQMELNNQILLRYCDADGHTSPEANPNGSLGNIAGISNANGNVMGLMPHPERASERLLGSDDGFRIFESLIHSLS
jgi:phosphoribosylformylglycinamidine synthase